MCIVSIVRLKKVLCIISATDYMVSNRDLVELSSIAYILSSFVISYIL
jgi:hypothetical protein